MILNQEENLFTDKGKHIMTNEVRLAEMEELHSIYEFYTEICRALESEKYSPLWQIGFYPCADDIKNHINQKNMYIAVCDNKIAAAMAVSDHGDFSSLHLLTVRPDFRGQHLGESMMKKLVQIAEERSNSRIILDVVKGNLPAERLYQKAGFKYVGEKCENIERVGKVCFCIYEYIPESK